MDRSNSTSSNASSSSKSTASGPFAYQTRLLERTSSRSGTLSRSNSQTGMAILTTPTGSSTTSTTPRRWTPSHRVANSLDAVRGKWEERTRDAMTEEPSHYPPSSPTKDTPRSRTPTLSVSHSSVDLTTSLHSFDSQPSTPSGSQRHVDLQRTPTYLKRRTMPAPIIASPLSPNITGITVEADSPSSATPNRIHLPSSASFLSSRDRETSSQPLPSPGTTRIIPGSRYNRSNTLDSIASTSWSGLSKPPEVNPQPSSSSSSSTAQPAKESYISLPTSPPVRRRPTSIHGSYSLTPSPDKPSYRPSSGSNNSGSASFLEPEKSPPIQVSSPTPSAPSAPSSSVMSPAPYRSSYMANKKTSGYGDSLGVGRRKLGRHLPRIASGDAPDDWQAEKQPSPQKDKSNSTPTLQERRERRLREWDTNIEKVKASPTKREVPVPAPGVDDVAGLPGRIQLKAPSAPSSPMPSARLLGGLWADKQRHLIQAYEYLCHVGEAQQWIEGCLGEELGFGVVEMEDGLRNGVVLAKLVRAFQGDAAVKKIYEAPKLDFRHSDNINVFFNFVRHVGLPEGFIFELTDLYEKKNLPKVIYCIHALSHLLARRGMAERIGNLLGQLHFSDDQLQRTQKGLKDSGVAMPNFGNVGRELAKEINEEPEVEIETEEEKRDRLLLENEGSVIMLQARLRGFLERKAHRALHNRIRFSERHVAKLQTHCRALLVRRRLEEQRKTQHHLIPWATALQAVARGVLARKSWYSQLRRIRASARYVIKIQAQIRGVIQRRRYAQLKTALRKINFSVTRLQAVARARVTRHARTELTKTFTQPKIGFSIVGFQSCARGVIARRVVSQKMAVLRQQTTTFITLQAQCRGVLMRRRMRAQMAKIENVTNVVVQIQAAVRTYLARKRLLMLIRGLRRVTPMMISLQARARASLARQKHQSLNKALTEVKTIVSVGGIQALARAALARNKHREIHKNLEVSEPDAVGFQAAARGALLRRDYRAWRDHLRRSHPVATILQAMLRGTMQRRTFREKMGYYRANLSKVVKIQSLFRAKETREQYRQLTLGKNVTVGTIKNFVHLLDDSEADFQEEIKVERLRKRVVEHIRENQSLESEVYDLDTTIALVVQNAKSFEDLIKARRRHGDSAAAHAARMSLLAAHGDPFSGPNTLDHEARHKLELYQQLFYLLQTKGEYLSRLFTLLSMDTALETNRRFIERAVLTLFGHGQDRREDFLLLKVFQLAIREEIGASFSMEDIVRGHPIYLNIAVNYDRAKQVTYAKDALQSIIRELADSVDVNLEVNPSVIYQEKTSKDVTFHEALKDPDTRAEYIRHLQILQWWTEAFVTAIIQSTKRMPYGMRYLVRETLMALREKFPGVPDEVYAACLGRLVYNRYINPAICAPETFDIVTQKIGDLTGKNLGQISKILTQITSGVEFDDNNLSYVAINDYVRKAIGQMSAWFIEVANVPDAETQFHAHEFLDVTVQPKPIYISPNEIYTMHGILSHHVDFLAPAHDDTLRVMLAELGGVPHLGNEELKDARDIAITLQLTNRFAYVDDPHAEEKTLWVQAKRGVLAILRVQPAQDLLESLMRPVTEKDEFIWEEILEAEMENEIRQMPRRQPSAVVNDSAYRLEDIRSLKFAAVKALAISNLLELEKQGKITRNDNFQGILNAIAGDVRSKHRKRLQRQQEMKSMNEALRQLAERKKYFEEQINSYHDYIEAAMNTMQRGKGKKRFVLPFTKQYFHLRELQRSGENPQFGSFLYTAKDLYDKGILLSVDQYSPRQFDKLQFTMSSRTAGIFNLLLESTMLGVATRIASEDIRMEDLLQAKYEKRSSLSLFNGKAKVNFELFLYQINKKFYV